MRQIRITSNTYSYVIVKNFVLRPYMEGILEDNGDLIKSEYRSLKNLIDNNKILVSADDYNYIKIKAGISSGSVGDGYSKEEVDLLLETKLNINGVASSAYVLSPGRVIGLGGDLEGSSIFVGDKDILIDSKISKLGKAGGIATLDSNGFVPSSQLNIGNNSGPFIVKEWDVENLDLEDIVPIVSSNVEISTVGDLVDIEYIVPEEEDMYLKNTFFKSSDNIDYIDGSVVYSGVIEGTSSMLPFPSIAFNNVEQLSFKYSSNPTSYSTDLGLILSRSVTLEEAIFNSNDLPLNVILTIQGGAVYVDSKSYPIEEGEYISIYKNGNIFNISIGNNNHSIDISEFNRPNPDLVWNFFVALVQNPNSSNEYDNTYKIPLLKVMDNRFGGTIYNNIPESFKFDLQSFTSDNSHQYLFSFNDKEKNTIKEVTDDVKDFILFYPKGGFISLTLEGNTNESIVHDFSKNIEIEVNSLEKSLLINGIKYISKSTKSWVSFSTLFVNTLGSGINSNIPNFSYKLFNFKKETYLPAIVPSNSKDGDIFKVVSKGIFDNKELKDGDYVTIYNNLSNIILTRIPPNISEEEIESLLDFKLLSVQSENKAYTDSKFNSIKLNYRGTFQFPGNIYVENAREGDYVIITNGGNEILPYYYVSNNWKSETPGNISINSDSIIEGEINKFFTNSNAYNYLNNYRYLNVNNINSFFENGWITPGGNFENKTNKISSNLKNYENDINKYPTTSAISEYVKEKTSTSISVDSVTNLTVTLKESRYSSNDSSVKFISKTVNEGSCDGTYYIKRYEGEIYDSNYPKIPTDWPSNVRDGFILDIGFTFLDGISSGPDMKLGLSYVLTSLVPDEKSFIGIYLSNGKWGWRVTGYDQGGKVSTISGIVNFDNTLTLRFKLINDELKIYQLSSNKTLILLQTISMFAYTYTLNKFLDNFILYSNISNANQDITKVSLTYKSLIKI